VPPHGPQIGVAFGCGQVNPAPVQNRPVVPLQHGCPEAPQSLHSPPAHVPPDMQVEPEAMQTRLSQHPPAEQALPAQQGWPTPPQV
jgi:hypothetical protein